MDLEPIQPTDASLEIVEPLCAVFRQRLKAEGQKYTPERARVLDAVIRTDGVFEADALIADLAASGFRVSKATVYRTIKLMLDAGIIQKVLSDADNARYQLAYGTKPDDLIVRVDTDEYIRIDAPELIELRDRLCAQHGLKATGHRLHIYATAD